ncbi:MAG TPA: enoyl-ACP reductase [Pirellulaceae bacterium]|jgi:enoyl-[acyl-carrier protein] reductase I|nr:enoyl-ACP reductase [Pirellulaceae bacterium]
MGLMDGKKGLILGVANDHSIAWAIAQEVMKEGALCGFSHLPDPPGDERRKSWNRVQKLTSEYPATAKFLVPLDVRSDANIAELVATTKQEFGTIDFLVHSMAFASIEDLKRETVATSREGFLMAMDISAYSLLALSNAFAPLMNANASILAMTYYGGEKCVPGYNVMGVCKAALDSCVKYAAYDLGSKSIRVNAISAGPLKTLAGSAAGVKEMLPMNALMSPLGRNIEHAEVGKSALFLLSDLSQAITGEILHVDAGFNIMGAPTKALTDAVAADALKKAKV